MLPPAVNHEMPRPSRCLGNHGGVTDTVSGHQHAGTTELGGDHAHVVQYTGGLVSTSPPNNANVVGALVLGGPGGVAQLIADTSGALVSVGLGDLYAVNTFSGLKPRPGTMIAFWSHRTNEAEPSLMVDGYGPVAFLAADGTELAPGAVVEGQLQMVVWDEAVSPEKPAWRKINPAATDLQVLNAQTVMEALAALLPKEAPDGAGKLWYNNGMFQVTTGAQS